jgi:inorganic pyrophosphatase
MKKLLIFSLVLLVCSACQTNYEGLPAYSGTKQLQAVIEIPAGSAHVYKYDAATQSFPAAQEAGQDKVIKFLPYPGNYGFIPSTKLGKEGKFLQVLILGEKQESGTLQEITPLAVLLLEEAGELEYKIIAVPAKPSERLLSATDYIEFSSKYPSVKRILELWFLNYDPTNKAKIMGWKDDRFAEELVQKWLK